MCLIAIPVAILVAALFMAQCLLRSPGPWEQPAAELADQIAAILGPGQAHLTLANLSSHLRR